ncbi:MAG TPA: Hsp70 family protein [Polyangiaceae bacterium]|nr:Hsp70 family protein [Polyangiaceae bacterium]
MVGRIVGIDLGTTQSAVGLFENGTVRPLTNALGEVLTPSAVAFDERSGKVVVGREAKDILALRPELGALSFKRWIGSTRAVRVGSRELTATELSAYVLDSLRLDAERALGEPVSRCVISVPAYFAEPQRLATLQAAQLAGFSVERLINEPTAAALAYGIDSAHDERTFMVFDLGGGTFDVCVMELFEGVLQVKGVAGESQLGGDDFTAALGSLALSLVGLGPEQLDRTAHATLARRTELLKRKLSRWSEADIVVPTPRGDYNLRITRAEAEHAFAPLLERLKGPCRSALRAAGMTAGDLDEILLVGGATHMPCIAPQIAALLGKSPTTQPDPELTVARGAAMHAGMCARDAALEDRVITDVAAHSLGVQVSTRIGTTLVPGRFRPIIDRGTVLPTSRRELFATLAPKQSAIAVKVFEGVAREVKDNTLLGELLVQGIPPGPPRDAIEITFTYDVNGVLEVEVTVLESGHKASRIFTRDGNALSEAELAQAQASISQLKQDPAERPSFRELLARANLIWSDVAGEQRMVLEEALRGFEEAMQTRTPSVITTAENRLRKVCEYLDQGERW